MINRPYNFRLEGRAREVFKMLEILAKTKPLESDLCWWVFRADVIARDRDLVTCGLSITERLLMRRD